ncbi:MAG: mechanosensitive ion channel [Pseudomonadales bacterium]|nr:mechanosensitive ion channel [Pseudomonadales bacterium]
MVDKLIRSVVRVGMVYGSPIQQARKLLERALKEQPEVLSDPEPQVIFEDFGDNALIYIYKYGFTRMPNAAQDLCAATFVTKSVRCLKNTK